ncbi:DUF4760 domain-containing protein [Actinomadura sp. 3N407]|uniref:DUF4760 domain-containing protein n=1 Tax=Actinomadura sp. 3N407 TaxID=3457423 RepID=UPI003FCDCFDB
MAHEHPADSGWRGLSDEARTHANTIGLFYDDLAKLVAHGVIDQTLVIGSYGTNIVRLWDALAAYVYTERREYRLHFWIYFEDLAARTASTHPETVHADLRLQSRPHGSDPPPRATLAAARPRTTSTG